MKRKRDLRRGDIWYETMLTWNREDIIIRKCRQWHSQILQMCFGKGLINLRSIPRGAATRAADREGVRHSLSSSQVAGWISASRRCEGEARIGFTSSTALRPRGPNGVSIRPARLGHTTVRYADLDLKAAKSLVRSLPPHATPPVYVQARGGSYLSRGSTWSFAWMFRRKSIHFCFRFR